MPQDLPAEDPESMAAATAIKKVGAQEDADKTPAQDNSSSATFEDFSEAPQEAPGQDAYRISQATRGHRSTGRTAVAKCVEERADAVPLEIAEAGVRNVTKNVAQLRLQQQQQAQQKKPTTAVSGRKSSAGTENG